MAGPAHLGSDRGDDRQPEPSAGADRHPMKLPDASWRTRSGMPRLLRALDAAAGETRFVGGCVRDTLLDLAVSDVDLATRLAPEEVMRRLGAAGIKAVPTGLAHGTVTAVIGGQPIEVTTLR